MCGIVGVVNGARSAGHLLDGLRQLEYRGYDSSGIAVIEDNDLKSRKATGKLKSLITTLDNDPIDGPVGIAHTRWATHGAPTEINAHPHIVDDVAVVHNGIIENFKELRTRLSGEGRTFLSDTDTEVVPHLINHYLDLGCDTDSAIHNAISELQGAYALGIIVKGDEDRMFAARRGSPLAIGYGDDATFLASDGMALAPMTNSVSYLEEGDMAVLERGSVEIVDARGKNVCRRIVKTELTSENTGKGEYRHFMLKEIHEQPTVVRQTLEAYGNAAGDGIEVPDLPFTWPDLTRLSIIACGTSSYAGQVARYWFEDIARIPVDVDIASEFRYRNAPMPENGAALFISQSGETADTLAALRFAKEQGQHIIGLVNVPESTIARESDTVLQTFAGPEIGVASTKAFTAQLTVLAVLALHAGLERGTLSPQEAAEKLSDLKAVPQQIERTLAERDTIERVAGKVAGARSALFIGRGACFPIALEGALKLKEISYIHAEGFGAGELKHGPIALVDDETPVIAMVPRDHLYEKSVSNLQEVRARGARIVAVSDREGLQDLEDDIVAGLTVPESSAFTAPFLLTVPLQLLSYEVAVKKGTDVDQPRNLAKSVTVE